MLPGDVVVAHQSVSAPTPQPGDTQYDFVVFQIPADAKPQSLVFTNMSVPVSTD